jgi:hypothetical protein
MNVLDFLDEYSSSSSRTLGFDRKKAERENWNVFLMMCKRMNGVDPFDCDDWAFIGCHL